jgi:hypothetical protein
LEAEFELGPIGLGRASFQKLPPPYSDIEMVLLSFTMKFEDAEGSCPNMAVVAASSSGEGR